MAAAAAAVPAKKQNCVGSPSNHPPTHPGNPYSVQAEAVSTSTTFLAVRSEDIGFCPVTTRPSTTAKGVNGSPLLNSAPSSLSLASSRKGTLSESPTFVRRRGVRGRWGVFVAGSWSERSQRGRRKVCETENTTAEREQAWRTRRH